MKTIRTLFIVFGLSCLNANAQNYPIKDSLKSDFNGLVGVITESKIIRFLDDIERKSSLKVDMCFTTLGEYNNCLDNRQSIKRILYRYMDDLIGKHIDSADLIKWNKPWEDEDYYELSFRMYYANTNDGWPVNVNFDTIHLGVNEGRIKNIVYAREWVELATYGEE